MKIFGAGPEKNLLSIFSLQDFINIRIAAVETVIGVHETLQPDDPLFKILVNYGLISVTCFSF